MNNNKALQNKNCDVDKEEERKCVALNTCSRI